MKFEKELRIGNLIHGEFYDEDDVEVCRVMAIDETASLGDGWSIMVEGSSGKEWYSDFRGIPLTEELLLRFGFDENQDLLARGLIMRYNLTNQTIELIRYETLIDFEIKYVHTLQNLYFALTGEELTFKN